MYFYPNQLLYRTTDLCVWYLILWYYYDINDILCLCAETQIISMQNETNIYSTVCVDEEICIYVWMCVYKDVWEAFMWVRRGCGWGGLRVPQSAEEEGEGGNKNKKAGGSETLHKHLAAWIFLKYLALEESNLLTETLWDALCFCDRCLSIRMKLMKACMLNSSSIRDRQELRGTI